jgi:hypothetical protein
MKQHRTLLSVYIGEFQLGEEQLQRVVSGTPKKHYFLRQGGVGRMLELSLGAEELAILRSDNRAQASLDTALLAKEAGNVRWQDVYFDAIR